jgi:hypothetical protein
MISSSPFCAAERVNAYIPAMENCGYQKESWRLDAMFAALDVAGRCKDVPILEEVLPVGQRRYLYPNPDAGPLDDLGTSKLGELLICEQISHGINLDKSSPNFGVRYMPKAMPTPGSLEPFVTEAAQSAWKAWRDEQLQMDEALIEAIQNPELLNPTSDERSRADRIKDRASEMRTAAPERRTGAKNSAERD